MKIISSIATLLFTLSLNASSGASLEAFDLTQEPASVQDVEAIPAVLSCDGLVLSQANSLEPLFQHDFADQPETELMMSVKVSLDGAQILFDSLDGDQIDSVLFNKSDLLALANGEAEFIVGQKYHGFWWRDGKTIEVVSIPCTLLSSK
jgi:hypothetical protein